MADISGTSGTRIAAIALYTTVVNHPASQDIFPDRMNTTTLLQFWDSDTPEYITKLLHSVESNNPDLDYVLFDDEQAASYIQEHYGQDMQQIYRSCALPSMRADLFRYFFLLREGGFYIDADFSCSRSLEPLLDKGDSGCLYERKAGICNGMLYVREPQNPLIDRILQEALSNIKSKTSNSVWAVTGPGIIQRLYANERNSHLFEGFGIIDDDEFYAYFGIVTGLEYKRGDDHWTVARDKGLSIFN